MNPRRVLVAPDSFRGSLDAAGVAAALADGISGAAPDSPVVRLPLADGGEGTLAALVGAGFSPVPARGTGPDGAAVSSAFVERAGLAVIELAAVAGILLVRPADRRPRTAASHGVGDLIRAALDRGHRDLVLAVGGSACTDGGAGMLVALGARLTDAAGRRLPPGGAALADLAAADLSGLDPRLAGTRIVLAADVDNPLLGAHGAAAVYGPQKGAGPADVAALEAGLARLAAVLDPAGRWANAAGAGAAGGVGFAALAVLGAQRRPGIELLLELTGFPGQLARADLVVTGEGRIDRQTLRGKAPLGVLRAARAAGVPVVAVCGRLDLSADELRAAGFGAGYALTALQPDVEVCLARPVPLLREVGRTIAHRHLAGGEKGGPDGI